MLNISILISDIVLSFTICYSHNLYPPFMQQLLYNGSSIIRHLDNPEHLNISTHNFGVNVVYIEVSPE